MASDRRVKYTRMVLNESLLKALENKPLARITVKEICEYADINRSTYYTHYDNPYDQLSKLESEILEDMKNAIELTSEDNSEGASDEENRFKIIKSCLEYIFKRREVFKILLQKNGNIELPHDFLALIGQTFFRQYESSSLFEDTAEGRYKYIFASAGSFGIIRYWITEDSDAEIDDVASMMTRFIPD